MTGDPRRFARRRGGRAVVLAPGHEDVEHAAAAGAATPAVLHPARHDVGLVDAELMFATAHDQHLDALEHDADLLVRVAV